MSVHIGRQGQVDAPEVHLRPSSEMTPEAQPGVPRSPRLTTETKMRLVGGLAFLALVVGVVSLVINSNIAATNTADLQHQLAAQRADLQHQLATQRAGLQHQLTTNAQELAALKGTQDGAVQASLAAITSSVGALQRTVSGVSSSVSGLSRTASGLQGVTRQFTICIPELQQEITRLNVSTTGQSITLADGSTVNFLGSAYMNNPTVISTNCNKVLTGQ
jgi:hypothetical protein